MFSRKLLVGLILAMIFMEVKSGPVITISSGRIRGVYMTSRGGRRFNGFLGIPFAKVPERFEPPEPALNWGPNVIRNNTAYGSRCAQSKRGGNGSPIPTGTEDCLFINVFTPKLSGKLPVIVVIESGGFINGYAENSGPKYFLDEDVVIVTFNYRLGAFGFLSTGDEVIPGNMGLKDQLLALRWVQNNIHYFGGDKLQVTIQGDSSGGASVTFHLVSPLSQGLFKYAIVQSGSLLNPRYFTKNLSSDTKAFAQKLGCPTSNSRQMVTCLKKKPMADIRDKIIQDGNVLNTERAIFTPTLEKPLRGHSRAPAFLTESPERLLRQGRFRKVPVIMTLTKDEGLLFFSALVQKTPSLLKELNDNWFTVAPIAFHYSRLGLSAATKDRISERLRNFYFGPSNLIDEEKFGNLTALYSDSFIISSLKRHALYHARYAPVYAAVLAYPGTWSTIFSYGYTSPIGVAHADDMQYLFDNTAKWPEFPPGSLHETVSRHNVRIWTNFAKTGNPQFALQNVTWTPVSNREITAGDINWLYMKERLEHRLEPLRSRLKLWDWIQEVINNESGLL